MASTPAPSDNTIGADGSLPQEAMLDSRVESLMAMGFEPAACERALRRANNDFDAAVTMLTSGMLPAEDHFDILSDAPDGGGTAPVKGPAPISAASGETKTSDDHFREGLPKDAPVSAILDARVQQLIEMGFSAEDAEQALKASGNDFDQAVQLLTTTDELAA